MAKQKWAWSQKILANASQKMCKRTDHLKLPSSNPRSATEGWGGGGGGGVGGGGGGGGCITTMPHCN